MPTYDYICTSCGHAWELEQRIVEDAIKVCPSCGKANAKRQISSGAGFILKGGGWYADGYGSAKPASSSSDEPAKPEAKGDKDKKSEHKTEATPAAEPAQKSESPSAADKGATTPATPAKPTPAKPSAA